MKQDPAIERQICFQPPNCPNPKCTYHLAYPKNLNEIDGKKPHRLWRYRGWENTLCHPYRVRRYDCKACQSGFRYTSFKLSFREKRSGLNVKIFRLFICGISNREIGRQLGCSERLVRDRLSKMAKFSLLKHTKFLESTQIEEPIVYDGLRNFAKSQFEPNDINQALGKDSLFIYDFNFAPLNRSGRMSPRQKGILAHLDLTLGRYSSRAIRNATEEIFNRLYMMRKDPSQPLVIYSDEHYQYDRVVRRDLKDLNIIHHKTSSKDCRNYKNHLFAINHSDLLIRQHVGAFSRETICFAKKHERMIQKFVLFMVWKNYFRTQYVKPHKRNPAANKITPAMALKLTSKPLAFHEFFDLKLTPTQVKLNREWECFYYEWPIYTRQRVAA